MYIRMKNYIELILGAMIVVLLIEVPEFLDEMAQSSLGKILLLSSVAFLLCHFGKNAGILAAIVVVIILYKTKEGFEGLTLSLGGKKIVQVGGDNPPNSDATCKAKAEKDGTKLVKWQPPQGGAPGKCVEGMSGHKIREGNVDPCNGATDNSSCDKCSKGKKPFFVNGKCSATEGFSSKEVDALKRLAAREGFAGYNGRQRYLKPYWNTLNTTDLDRDVKEKAERAKLSASKEDKPNNKQKKDIDNKAMQNKKKKEKQ